MCCPCCYYDKLHLDHKLIKLSEIKNLENDNFKNFSVESQMDEFNDISQSSIYLKNRIEYEINQLNQIYDKTINDLQNTYQKKYEQLLKQETE